MALQWRGSLTGEDREIGTVYRVLMHQGKFAAVRTLPEQKDCGTFDTMDEARKACDESAKGDPQRSPPEPEKPSAGPQTLPEAKKPASEPPKPAAGHPKPKGR